MNSPVEVIDRVPPIIIDQFTLMVIDGCTVPKRCDVWGAKRSERSKPGPGRIRDQPAQASYYSSIRPFTGGQTVREWLTGQRFADQYNFGRRINGPSPEWAPASMTTNGISQPRVDEIQGLLPAARDRMERGQG
jgi:hypothetical protein